MLVAKLLLRLSICYIHKIKLYFKIRVINDIETGCQVYVFDIFDEIWVAFRGTQVTSIDAFIKDVTTDINCALTKTDYLPQNCMVHTGFDKSYQSVREEVLEELENEYSIRLIGHSLGGALATLLAGDIRYKIVNFSKMFLN